jgi:hypothetical protein
MPLRQSNFIPPTIHRYRVVCDICNFIPEDYDCILVCPTNWVNNIDYGWTTCKNPNCIHLATEYKQIVDSLDTMSTAPFFGFDVDKIFCLPSADERDGFLRTIHMTGSDEGMLVRTILDSNDPYDISFVNEYLDDLLHANDMPSVNTHMARIFAMCNELQERSDYHPWMAEQCEQYIRHISKCCVGEPAPYPFPSPPPHVVLSNEM